MSSNLPGPVSFSGTAEEKLTIETPEQTALEFPLAGIGSRFLALALDSLIQWAVGERNLGRRSAGNVALQAGA